MTITRSQWLFQNGFKIDPFRAEARSAEGDTILEGAFHKMNYYTEIRGDYHIVETAEGRYLQEPGPRFIFGKRGQGKTALRMRIINELQELFDKWGDNSPEKVLTVIYNDFEPVLHKANHKPEAVTPRMHVERIVTLIVRCLVETWVNRYSDDHTTRNVGLLEDKHDRRLLSWYIHQLGHFHQWEANKIFGRLEGYEVLVGPETALKVVKSAAKATAKLAGGPALEQIIGAFTDSLSGADIPNTTPAEISMQELLEGIVNLCCKAGYEAVMVLVDDIDEPQYYGEKGNYKPAFHLIHPLISASKLIAIDRLVFKFFLPFEIRENCLKVVRLDKFGERIIRWQLKDYSEMLQTRLRHCSKYEDPKNKLDGLYERGDFDPDLDQELVDFAKEHNSPRALMIAGNELMSDLFKDDLAETDTSGKGIIITRPVWNRARQRAEEVLR